MEELLQSDYQKAIMLGGLPGSGKTTFRRQYENDYFIICKDDIRLFFAQQKHGDIPESQINDLEKFNSLVKLTIPLLMDMYFNQYYIEQIKNNIDFFISISDKILISSINKKDYESICKYLLLRINDLPNKKGIIFDATHFVKYQRNDMIRLINKRCPIYMIYFYVTVEQAKIGVKKRVSTIIDTINNVNVYGRDVPDEIIEKFASNEHLPEKKEGFKQVFILKKETNM